MSNTQKDQLNSFSPSLKDKTVLRENIGKVLDFIIYKRMMIMKHRLGIGEVFNFIEENKTVSHIVSLYDKAMTNIAAGKSQGTLVVWIENANKEGCYKVSLEPSLMISPFVNYYYDIYVAKEDIYKTKEAAITWATAFGHALNSIGYDVKFADFDPTLNDAHAARALREVMEYRAEQEVIEMMKGAFLK